jgi:hypothetical protein
MDIKIIDGSFHIDIPPDKTKQLESDELLLNKQNVSE